MSRELYEFFADLIHTLFLKGVINSVETDQLIKKMNEIEVKHHD